MENLKCIQCGMCCLHCECGVSSAKYVEGVIICSHLKYKTQGMFECEVYDKVKSNNGHCTSRAKIDGTYDEKEMLSKYLSLKSRGMI